MHICSMDVLKCGFAWTVVFVEIVTCREPCVRVYAVPAGRSCCMNGYATEYLALISSVCSCRDDLVSSRMVAHVQVECAASGRVG